MYMENITHCKTEVLPMRAARVQSWTGMDSICPGLRVLRLAAHRAKKDRSEATGG